MTDSIDELYTNVRNFLCTWYERDGEAFDEADLDEGVVDCVVGCVQQAWTATVNERYNILEGSSSYVQCDLNEEELEEYVELLEDCLAY